ncbi:MAG: hypothetical protein JNK64_34160 [Myxococcales bacterium]|nr:hypothetical protein [Myxococcales bacterium]
MRTFALSALALAACAAPPRPVAPLSQPGAPAARAATAPAPAAPAVDESALRLAVTDARVTLTCGAEPRVEFPAGSVDVAALTAAMATRTPICGHTAVVTVSDDARYRDFVAVADAAGAASVDLGIEASRIQATRPAPPRPLAAPTARPPIKLALPDSLHAVIDGASVMLDRVDVVDQIAAALRAAPGAGDQVILYATPDVSGRAIVAAVAGARHAGMPTVYFAARQ